MILPHQQIAAGALHMSAGDHVDAGELWDQLLIKVGWIVFVKEQYAQFYLYPPSLKLHLAIASDAEGASHREVSSG